MATHWFSTSDARRLLADKKVVIIGDSVQRGVYKDLVCLLTANQLLKIEELKRKGEDSFKGDQLLEGGQRAGLKSVNYKEVRKFTQGSTVVLFYFVTRCYGQYVKTIIATFENEPPDVIIMNSCLWDLSRYGKNACSEFETNISNLLEEIGLVIPYDSNKRMFIWNATLPVIDSSKSYCLPTEMPQEFKPDNENVRCANLYVYDQMINYGGHFVFVDLYHIFHSHKSHRTHDGVHWDDFAHRKITCLLLAEISKKWGFKVQAQEDLPPSSRTRRTVRPLLSRTPPVRALRSLPFSSTPPFNARRSWPLSCTKEWPLHHSVSPYRRPSPRYIDPVHHSPLRMLPVPPQRLSGQSCTPETGSSSHCSNTLLDELACWF